MYGDAVIFGDAKVFENARVRGNARICSSSDCTVIGPFGQLDRYLTITKSNGMVTAGCFNGTVEQFKTAVDHKYRGEGNYYLAMALIKTLMANWSLTTD